MSQSKWFLKYCFIIQSFKHKYIHTKNLPVGQTFGSMVKLPLGVGLCPIMEGMVGAPVLPFPIQLPADSGKAVESSSWWLQHVALSHPCRSCRSSSGFLAVTRCGHWGDGTVGTDLCVCLCLASKTLSSKINIYILIKIKSLKGFSEITGISFLAWPQTYSILPGLQPQKLFPTTIGYRHASPSLPAAPWLSAWTAAFNSQLSWAATFVPQNNIAPDGMGLFTLSTYPSLSLWAN